MAEQEAASTVGRILHHVRDSEPPTCSSVSSSMQHTGTDVGHDQPMTRNAESLAENTSSEEVRASEMSHVTSDDPSTGGLSCRTGSADVRLSSVLETQQPELNPSNSVVDPPVAGGRPPKKNVHSSAETSGSHSVEPTKDRTPAHVASAPSDCIAMSSQSVTSVSDRLIVSSSSSSSADSEAVNIASMDTTISCVGSDDHLPVVDNNQSLYAHPVSESVSLENIQSSPSEPLMVCTSLIPLLVSSF